MRAHVDAAIALHDFYWCDLSFKNVFCATVPKHI